MKVAHSPEPAEERVVFRDGLGVRERRDLPGGEVVEWFHLVADFSATEALLRERMTRLAKFQHVKFSRILGIEGSGKGRGPILVSSYLPGPRLAEVLEMAGHGLVTFDVGAGLHVTREVLGGLAVLHDSRTVAHGALAPERVVLGPNGRVVIVEHVLGPAIDRLQRPRHQLWREWRIPTPPASGPVKLDIQADLAQTGLLAIAALLGRPVDEEEYPHRLRGVLPLIQDRLSRSPAAGIAGEVVAWLERLAPLDSRRAFTSAREAQQAYERLVAGSATAMGITSARVKGVIAAVAALAPAPVPSAVSAPPAAPTDAAAPMPADPIVVRPAPSAPTSPESVADQDIDIEALLRLEAELEGGSAPVPDPVTRAARAARAPAEVVAPSLEALEQERRELQQQFASLVEAVAPAADAGPVHLIPETPSTSEPLVDERVRWSSMPAADLADVPTSIDATCPIADVVALATEPAVGATVVEVEAIAAVGEEVAQLVPMASEPAPGDGDVTSALGESFEIVEAVVPDIPLAIEPIAVIAPQEPAPTAAIEHVPADWWREALPWRDGDQAAPEASDSPATVAAGEAEVVVIEDALVPMTDGASDDVAAAPTAVAEDFGYLSLEAIEARATRIGDGDPRASEDEVGQDLAVLDGVQSAGALEALSIAVADDEPVPLPVADPRTPFGFLGDEPATLEFSAELLHDEPATFESPSRDDADAVVPADSGTPDEAVAAAMAEADVAVLDATPATVVPEDVSVSADATDAADAAPAPGDDAESDPYARPTAVGLFGDLRPIMLQDLEPAVDEMKRDAASPFMDADPLQAASSLFAHAEGGAQEADWRDALLGAAVSPVEESPAHPQVPDVTDAVAAEAADDHQTEPEPLADALEPALTVCEPEATSPEVATVEDAVALAADVPVAAEPPADPHVPEIVIVDGDADHRAWEQLTSEAPHAETSPAPVEVVSASGGAEDEEPDVAIPVEEHAGVSLRRKRRRSRRKKTQPVPPSAPVVEAPTVTLPVVIAAVEPEVAPSPVAAAPMVMAPVLPPEAHDPVVEKAALHAVVAARPTSLLEREVPQWTPPADMGVLRPRVVQPTADEMAASVPSPAPHVPVVATSSGSDDGWGTGSYPATAVASGEVVISQRPSVVRPAPVAMPAPPPVAPVLDLSSGSEAARPLEYEIRAVGMPDAIDLDPRSAGAALTTAADAIGPTPQPSGRGSAEPRLSMSLPEPARRGVNWRRMMAAAALIALFNGAALAAWWLVQPGARGTLVVETGRAGVEVLVDGTVMGRTPFRGEVKPGRHTLRLRQGTIVRDMPVEITDGVVTTQAVEWLAGGGGRGALQVSSNPPGAELLVNGKARGTTPVLLEDLPEGDQQLTIRSEAGTVTTTATVVAGEITPVEVKVFAGWVLVDSEYEVDLILGRKRIGTSMDGQILLPPGPYRLKAENRSLGIDQYLTFSVEPGAVTRLPLKVSPAYFDAPEGTEVIVDGATLGTGPGRIAITPGTHEVVVRHADGSEKHFSGIVRADRAFEP